MVLVQNVLRATGINFVFDVFVFGYGMKLILALGALAMKLI
jgi:hypothetical protein